MISRQYVRLFNVGAVCLLLATSYGCNRGSVNASATGTSSHGPHGGHTMQSSAEHQFEFTIDEKNRRMVIYVQKSGSREPHALGVESLDAQIASDGLVVDAKFSADPRRSDPDGQSSRFALGVDELPQQLISTDQFRLTVSYWDGEQTITAVLRHNNNHAHRYKHD